MNPGSRLGAQKLVFCLRAPTGNRVTGSRSANSFIFFHSTPNSDLDRKKIKKNKINGRILEYYLIDPEMPLPDQSLEPSDTLKSYSCLTCRQRKVRCDRRTPCSNCIKAEKQCSFIPPVRGRRRRTKPPREGLHAKLKRYEELLRSYGVKVEPSDDGEESESEVASQHDTEMKDVVEPQSQSLDIDEANPKLITKEGSSRYFDRYGVAIGSQFEGTSLLTRTSVHRGQS